MARCVAACVVAMWLLLWPQQMRAQEGEEPVFTANEQQRLENRLRELEAAREAHEAATDAINREQEQLRRRVDEMEISKQANEDATRTIIRQAFDTVGAKINEYVVFGGTLETLSGWSTDFQGQSERFIRLDTFELDFEIQVNDWALGSVIIEYVDGEDTLFPTTENDEVAVDRLNVDTAFVTLGNTQRWWPFGVFGRMILPFGISTGDPVADVLTIEDPLTVEVFEMREEAILVGFAFPTPPLRPLQTIPAPTPVRPVVVRPLVSKLARLLGYKPLPVPPPTASFVTLPPEPPPFNAGVYFFNGDTTDQLPYKGWSPESHIGATVGYRTRGVCRNYSQQVAPNEPELGWWHLFCPWTFDLDVDFNRSVFDTRFLNAEYGAFLPQIGFVPGMAASVKSNVGPISLVLEWNGAIQKAKFVDNTGRAVAIAPAAWQVSLGYQFDWNPQVEVIGGQGTYVTVGYSQSTDLAGVTRVIGGDMDRVGFVPRRRFLVGAGEWFFESVRAAIEYAHIIDYPLSSGGTGKSANGVFGQLTYEW